MIPFDASKTGLPILDVLGQVAESLQYSTNLILHAPPGAGKSTVVPLALLSHPAAQAKKILMLEPRRLATRSIAHRMAELLGEKVGQTVGYQIRFERKVSDETRIIVITEGILTRMLQDDNALEDVGLIIFDEFHERNIHSDAALAFCLDAQKILRPDLRILIMSATLAAAEISTKIKAPVIQSAGRQYPVDVIYTGHSDRKMLPELAAQVVLRALKEQTGDLLCFLPGEGEIRNCEAVLKSKKTPAQVYSLYGMLPKAIQDAAILPHPKGLRKVVLATSIAETSLTIEGVTTVIDSGWTRTGKFDPTTGLSRLETLSVSEDAADQRAGRAGRLGPGVCYRMWSIADQERLQKHRQPEILEADLASLMLDLANWGVDDPEQLTWVTPPPKGPLQQARSLLEDIGALDGTKITKHGKDIQRLPVHPRLAHMMLHAGAHDSLALGTDIAAILEERDPLGREEGIDLNLRIEALRRHREQKGQARKFRRIEQVASSYRELFRMEVDNSAPDPYETGFLLAQAYPERIAMARPGNNAQFQLANGALAMANHSDDLAWEQALAIAHMDAREGMGKIFMAAPLNPSDLAPLVQERDVVRWNDDEEELVAAKELRIGSIVLSSKPLKHPPEQEVFDTLTELIQTRGNQLLNFDEPIQQWQNRVMSLKHWRTQEPWPDVSTAHLLNDPQEWLGPYYGQLRRGIDFRKLNLLDILPYSLTHDLQQRLSQLAPEKLEVPSGSKIKIKYARDGSPPVLAVRIQEIFGMMASPRINEDQTSVLLHLLSPGFKAVQITSDLASFWRNGYFEVRKELKGRYPKHAWPDDPTTAEATRGAKKRPK
ncbi:MAG: ATP-dependent helicase HrpB [Bacteroidota bacterium]